MHESQQLKLYRLLVENSLGLMCIHDLDGVLLVINPAVAQSLGYRVEDGLGRNLREFLSPSVRPMFDDYLQRIRTNPVDSGLLRLQAKDGAERIWLYRNVRYEEAGSPARILGHALRRKMPTAAPKTRISASTTARKDSDMDQNRSAKGVANSSPILKPQPCREQCRT